MTMFTQKKAAYTYKLKKKKKEGPYTPQITRFSFTLALKKSA